MKKIRDKIIPAIFLGIFLAGLSVMLYPTFSNWWNRNMASHSVASYKETVASIAPNDTAALWEAARNYNKQLAQLHAPFANFDKLSGYDDLLNVSGTGVMGYISIPTIRVELPIYHGTEEGVLQVAAGHIQGSSLPVGGADTHAVISGHRGLPSAKLFTDLDRMVEGDIFTVNVLDDILTYEVEKILIILPDNTEELSIIPQKDYVTLMTCTPYGVNSHRLLIRAHRIDTIYDRHIRVPADALQLDRMTVIPVVFVIVLILMGIVSAIFNRNKRIIRIDKYITAKLPSGDFEKHEKQSSDIE